jgi:hypothetical protein
MFLHACMQCFMRVWRKFIGRKYIGRSTWSGICLLRVSGVDEQQHSKGFWNRVNVDWLQTSRPDVLVAVFFNWFTLKLEALSSWKSTRIRSQTIYISNQTARNMLSSSANFCAYSLRFSTSTGSTHITSCCSCWSLLSIVIFYIPYTPLTILFV